MPYSTSTQVVIHALRRVRTAAFPHFYALLTYLQALIRYGMIDACTVYIRCDRTAGTVQRASLSRVICDSNLSVGIPHSLCRVPHLYCTCMPTWYVWCDC